ncbi:hypothetical protein [Halobaculum limi]|uniref:hypothetical protein n=1 Tax=Halobaculum limi TaxID=3031916 RepID=UPI002406B1C4|nr:hypothetical protein [Halobaculum sp. YSMS11]
MSLPTGSPPTNNGRNRTAARRIGLVGVALPTAAVLVSGDAVAVFLAGLLAVACLASAITVAGDDDLDVAARRDE